MKNKLFKIFVVLILIVSITYIPMPIVQAGLLDGARMESGNVPMPSTPPSDPVTPTTPGNSNVKKERVYTDITYYTNIEGSVLEDLGEIISTGQGTGTETYKKGAAGVRVELLDESGKVVDKKITGADGKYSFSPKPGTYSVRFVYGDGDNKEQMKYNGYDYKVVQVPAGGTYETLNASEIQEEIKRSGKGCMQMCIAIDISASMEGTTTVINGMKMSRLKVATETAKKLVDTLLDSGENIWISIVVFEGVRRWRPVSLTKNKTLLKGQLDTIGKGGYTTLNTNMKDALEECKKSFVNNDINDSNRTIVLMSDGIPTSDGSTIIYNSDSDSTVMSKLTSVKSSTMSAIKNTRANGIKLISLFVKSKDKDENDWVQEIFGKGMSDEFYHVEDGIETIKIAEDIRDDVIATVTHKQYSNSVTVKGGLEDKARREEINKLFQGKFYNRHGNNSKPTEKISIFECSTAQDLQDLKTLTKINVMGGQGYKVEEYPYKDNPHEEITKLIREVTIKSKDANGNEKIEKQESKSFDTEAEYNDYDKQAKVEEQKYRDDGKDVDVFTQRYITRYMKKKYEKQDLVIAQIAPFELKTTVDVTGVNVKLSDGSILIDEKIDPKSSKPHIYAIDQEIVHGATIKVEYTVAVHNTSSYQCNSLDLLTYLPNSFMYLPSESDTKYNWKQADLASLYSGGYITENNGRRALELHLDNNNQGEKGFYIPPGGDIEFKMVFTKIVSNLNNIKDNELQELAVEIVGYSNEGNRRMFARSEEKITPASLLMQGTTIQSAVAIYPGNGTEQDYAQCSNKVSLLPPFGRKSKAPQVIVVLSGFVIITATTVVVMVKRKNAKKQTKTKK